MKTISNNALPSAMGLLLSIKGHSLHVQVSVKGVSSILKLKLVSGPAKWNYKNQAFDGILADEQNRFIDELRNDLANLYKQLWQTSQVTAEMLVTAYSKEHPELTLKDEGTAKYIERKRELNKAIDKLIKSKPRRMKDRLDFYYEKLDKLNNELEELESKHRKAEVASVAKSKPKKRRNLTHVPGTKPISVLFMPRRARLNKAGLCPIYCRLTISGVKATEFTTGVFTSPDKWNSTYRTILGDEEGTKKLETLANGLTAVYEEFMKRGKIPPPEEVISHYFDASLDFDKRWTLDDLIDKHLKDLKGKNRSRSTLTRAERVANYFREYSQIKYVEHVERHHVRGFRKWMIETKQASNDYANKCVQGVIGLLGTAVSYDIIKTNPGTGLRLEWERILDTTCLDSEELDLLRTTQFSERLQGVVDSFLFMCYTGLHIGDYKNLSAANLKTSYGTKFIELSRQKTKSPAIVPLHPIASRIIEKYGSIEELPRLSSQKSNDYLKLIAERIGTDKLLTNKVARKTFTDMSINQRGMSFEAVASMLGHTSTKFIKAYGKVNHHRILSEWRD